MAYPGGHNSPVLSGDRHANCRFDNQIVYPAPGNRTAELFAALTGTKTFSPRDLANIKALGYELEYVSAYTPEVV